MNPANEDDKPVFRAVALGLQIRLSDQGLYSLEKLRVSMDAKTSEDAIARAFREFLEYHGITFKSEMIPQEIFERFGLAASGNVSLIRKPGEFKVFLPFPEDKNWSETMRNKTGSASVNGLVSIALSYAYARYVKK